MQHVYIIAEIGPNHNGKIELAKEMIDQLSKIGVDAVKFQLTNPDLLYSNDSFKAKYQIDNDKSKTVKEMSAKHQLSLEEHRILNEYCRNKNVDYLCTGFDIESLKFLDIVINVKYFKIPSGEIHSIDLLEYISKRKKPILLSTGMHSFNEIKVSLDILNTNFTKEITIMHCVSNYPAPFETINLNNILSIRSKFGYSVGFSDHTKGIECALASIALGASVIEKHVTLDKTMEGPDHKASINVSEFHTLVNSIRNIEKAMGSYSRQIMKSEKEISLVAKKSIVAKVDINQGDIISLDKICYKRPGTGLSPLETNLIIGKKAKKPIKSNHVIKLEDIAL